MVPVLATVIGVLVLLLGGCSVSCVPAGHVGVVTTFGEVSDRQLPEGINMVVPWQMVQDMSIRTQEIMEAAETPTSEGIMMGVDTSVLFRINPAIANDLYQSVGYNYPEVVIIPNLRSAVRKATSSYRAEAMYSEARGEVAIQIQDTLETELADRGVIIESVLLRDLRLPPVLRGAIETKQKEEQEALRMQFVLQREEQEAERKRIEAGGIKDFQDIVSQGISERLLKWKGIEATQDLATSSNSKVIVIGSGEGGLPIILGGN